MIIDLTEQQMRVTVDALRRYAQATIGADRTDAERAALIVECANSEVEHDFAAMLRSVDTPAKMIPYVQDLYDITFARGWRDVEFHLSHAIAELEAQVSLDNEIEE